jgi:hypothetical protein
LGQLGPGFAGIAGISFVKVLEFQYLPDGTDTAR